MENENNGMLFLASGYARKGETAKTAFRRMTVDEAKALRYGQRVPFLANDGTARELKVNGAPKTWKRSPERVQVPIKYGLYEYGTVQEEPGTGFVEILLVKVEGEDA